MKNLRLLVMGNGPSLKKEHFGLFTGFPCLGMNAAYRYWERIGWYPDIYCCLDDQVVLTHADAIAEMAAKRRCKAFFLHQNILTRHPQLAGMPDVFFIAQLAPGAKHEERCKTYGLSHMPSDWFRSQQPSKLTTGSYSVRFAAYLGFRDIGLIGTDCRYVEVVQGAEAVKGIVLEMKRTPDHNPNYFFDDYQQAGDRYNLPNPSVHQGNLHLQAFEALAADIAHYKLDLQVSICTRESEIYDQKVFPFLDLESFIRGPALTSVFVPFTRKDLGLLSCNLKRWGTRAFAPYIFPPVSPRVELHFAMNGSQDDAAEKDLSAAWNDAGLARFFSKKEFHYSNLSGLRDLYTRHYKGAHGPEGYMAGPNNQFFDMVGDFSAGQSHIMLMEPDLVPIRANWLDALERMVRESERFWICGSPYRGRAVIQSFTHINGNAIYNVGDPGFRAFMDTVFRPYFLERMKTAPHLCYDILLHDMFLPLYQGKTDPALFERWKQIAHRFRFSEVMADVSHAEDRAPEALHTLASALAAFPGTYLLHGAVDRLFE